METNGNPVESGVGAPGDVTGGIGGSPSGSAVPPEYSPSSPVKRFEKERGELGEHIADREARESLEDVSAVRFDPLGRARQEMGDGADDISADRSFNPFAQRRRSLDPAAMLAMARNAEGELSEEGAYAVMAFHDGEIDIDGLSDDESKTLLGALSQMWYKTWDTSGSWFANSLHFRDQRRNKFVDGFNEDDGSFEPRALLKHIYKSWNAAHERQEYINSQAPAGPRKWFEPGDEDNPYAALERRYAIATAEDGAWTRFKRWAGGTWSDMDKGVFAGTAGGDNPFDYEETPDTRRFHRMDPKGNEADRLILDRMRKKLKADGSDAANGTDDELMDAIAKDIREKGSKQGYAIDDDGVPIRLVESREVYRDVVKDEQGNEVRDEDGNLKYTEPREHDGGMYLEVLDGNDVERKLEVVNRYAAENLDSQGYLRMADRFGWGLDADTMSKMLRANKEAAPLVLAWIGGRNGRGNLTRNSGDAEAFMDMAMKYVSEDGVDRKARVSTVLHALDTIRAMQQKEGFFRDGDGFWDSVLTGLGNAGYGVASSMYSTFVRGPMRLMDDALADSVKEWDGEGLWNGEFRDMVRSQLRAIGNFNIQSDGTFIGDATEFCLEMYAFSGMLKLLKPTTWLAKTKIGRAVKAAEKGGAVEAAAVRRSGIAEAEKAFEKAAQDFVTKGEVGGYFGSVNALNAAKGLRDKAVKILGSEDFVKVERGIASLMDNLPGYVAMTAGTYEQTKDFMADAAVGSEKVQSGEFDFENEWGALKSGVALPSALANTAVMVHLPKVMKQIHAGKVGTQAERDAIAVIEKAMRNKDSAALSAIRAALMTRGFADNVAAAAASSAKMGFELGVVSRLGQNWQQMNLMSEHQKELADSLGVTSWGMFFDGAVEAGLNEAAKMGAFGAASSAAIGTMGAAGTARDFRSKILAERERGNPFVFVNDLANSEAVAGTLDSATLAQRLEFSRQWYHAKAREYVEAWNSENSEAALAEWRRKISKGERFDWNNNGETVTADMRGFGDKTAVMFEAIMKECLRENSTGINRSPVRAARLVTRRTPDGGKTLAENKDRIVNFERRGEKRGESVFGVKDKNGNLVGEGGREALFSLDDIKFTGDEEQAKRHLSALGLNGKIRKTAKVDLDVEIEMRPKGKDGKPGDPVKARLLVTKTDPTMKDSDGKWQRGVVTDIKNDAGQTKEGWGVEFLHETESLRGRIRAEKPELDDAGVEAELDRRLVLPKESGGPGIVERAVEQGHLESAGTYTPSVYFGTDANASGEMAERLGKDVYDGLVRIAAHDREGISLGTVGGFRHEAVHAIVDAMRKAGYVTKEDEALLRENYGKRGLDWEEELVKDSVGRSTGETAETAARQILSETQEESSMRRIVGKVRDGAKDLLSLFRAFRRTADDADKATEFKAQDGGFDGEAFIRGEIDKARSAEAARVKSERFAENLEKTREAIAKAAEASAQKAAETAAEPAAAPAEGEKGEEPAAVEKAEEGAEAVKDETPAETPEQRAAREAEEREGRINGALGKLADSAPVEALDGAEAEELVKRINEYSERKYKSFDELMRSQDYAKVSASDGAEYWTTEADGGRTWHEGVAESAKSLAGGGRFDELTPAEREHLGVMLDADGNPVNVCFREDGRIVEGEEVELSPDLEMARRVYGGSVVPFPAEPAEEVKELARNAFGGGLTGESTESLQPQESSKFSIVSDRKKIDELEKGETIKVYRAMQLVDGKLYPPMAGRVDGKWQEPAEIGTWIQADERPDLVRDGKFVLNKGNGSSISAAYNPYWHTSRSMLNDQFSSAYKRPELVTVEVEVPKSELSSGYRADGAKDAVGEMKWHSGPVSSKLAHLGRPRSVILSRWCKIVRVIPDSEVAENVSNMLKDTGISIPANVVTPSLGRELAARGVNISGAGVDIGDKRGTMSVQGKERPDAEGSRHHIVPSAGVRRILSETGYRKVEDAVDKSADKKAVIRHGKLGNGEEVLGLRVFSEVVATRNEHGTLELHARVVDVKKCSSLAKRASQILGNTKGAARGAGKNGSTPHNGSLPAGRGAQWSVVNGVVKAGKVRDFLKKEADKIVDDDFLDLPVFAGGKESFLGNGRRGYGIYVSKGNLGELAKTIEHELQHRTDERYVPDPANNKNPLISNSGAGFDYEADLAKQHVQSLSPADRSQYNSDRLALANAAAKSIDALVLAGRYSANEKARFSALSLDDKVKNAPAWIDEAVNDKDVMSYVKAAGDSGAVDDSLAVMKDRERMRRIALGNGEIRYYANRGEMRAFSTEEWSMMSSAERTKNGPYSSSAQPQHYAYARWIKALNPRMGNFMYLIPRLPAGGSKHNIVMSRGLDALEAKGYLPKGTRKKLVEKGVKAYEFAADWVLNRNSEGRDMRMNLRNYEVDEALRGKNVHHAMFELPLKEKLGRDVKVRIRFTGAVDDTGNAARKVGGKIVTPKREGSESVKGRFEYDGPSAKLFKGWRESVKKGGVKLGDFMAGDDILEHAYETVWNAPVRMAKTRLDANGHISSIQLYEPSGDGKTSSFRVGDPEKMPQQSKVARRNGGTRRSVCEVDPDGNVVFFEDALKDAKPDEIKRDIHAAVARLQLEYEGFAESGVLSMDEWMRFGSPTARNYWGNNANVGWKRVWDEKMNRYRWTGSSGFAPNMKNASLYTFSMMNDPKLDLRNPESALYEAVEATVRESAKGDVAGLDGSRLDAVMEEVRDAVGQTIQDAYSQLAPAMEARAYGDRFGRKVVDDVTGAGDRALNDVDRLGLTRRGAGSKGRIASDRVESFYKTKVAEEIAKALEDPLAKETFRRVFEEAVKRQATELGVAQILKNTEKQARRIEGRAEFELLMERMAESDTKAIWVNVGNRKTEYRMPTEDDIDFKSPGEAGTKRSGGEDLRGKGGTTGVEKSRGSRSTDTVGVGDSAATDETGTAVDEGERMAERIDSENASAEAAARAMRNMMSGGGDRSYAAFYDKEWNDNLPAARKEIAEFVAKAQSAGRGAANPAKIMMDALEIVKKYTKQTDPNHLQNLLFDAMPGSGGSRHRIVSDGLDREHHLLAAAACRLAYERAKKPTVKVEGSKRDRRGSTWLDVAAPVRKMVADEALRSGGSAAEARALADRVVKDAESVAEAVYAKLGDTADRAAVAAEVEGEVRRRMLTNKVYQAFSQGYRAGSRESSQDALARGIRDRQVRRAYRNDVGVPLDELSESLGMDVVGDVVRMGDEGSRYRSGVEFAAAMRGRFVEWFRRANEDGTTMTDEEILMSPVARIEFATTAASWLEGAAKRLSYGRTRESAQRAAARMRRALPPTPERLERMVAHYADMIRNDLRVFKTENIVELIKREIDRMTRQVEDASGNPVVDEDGNPVVSAGASGARPMSASAPVTERGIAPRLQRYWKYVRDALDMTAEKVQEELKQTMNMLGDDFEEVIRATDEAPSDRAASGRLGLDEAIMKINALNRYGSLKYMDPGTALDRYLGPGGIGEQIAGASMSWMARAEEIRAMYDRNRKALMDGLAEGVRRSVDLKGWALKNRTRLFHSVPDMFKRMAMDFPEGSPAYEVVEEVRRRFSIARIGENRMRSELESMMRSAVKNVYGVDYEEAANDLMELRDEYSQFSRSAWTVPKKGAERSMYRTDTWQEVSESDLDVKDKKGNRRMTVDNGLAKVVWLEKAVPQGDSRHDDQSKTPTRLSKAHLIYIYSACRQADMKANNIVFGRNAEYFKALEAAIGPEGVRLADELTAIYARAREMVSPVAERLTGMQVLTPDERYAPLVFEQDRRPAKAKLFGVSPFPGWLMPRDKHDYSSLREIDALTLAVRRYGDAAHWAAFAEDAQYAREVLCDPKVAKMYYDAYGANAAKNMYDQMNDAFTGGSRVDHEFGAGIRNFVTVTTLGWNFASAMKQLEGIGGWSLEMGPAKWIKAVGLDWTFNHEETFAALRELDDAGLFRTRREEGISEPLVQLMRAKREGGNTGVARLWNKYKDKALSPTLLTDALATRFGAASFYLSKVRFWTEKGLSEADARRNALADTDYAIQIGQQSGRPEFMHDIQRGGIGGKFLAQFMGPSLVRFGYEVEAAHRAFLVDKTASARARFFGKLFAGHVICPAILATAGQVATYFLGRRNDENATVFDDFAGNLTVSMALGPISGWLILGQVIDSGVRRAFLGDRSRYSISVASKLEQIANDTKSLYDDCARLLTVKDVNREFMDTTRASILRLAQDFFPALRLLNVKGNVERQMRESERRARAEARKAERKENGNGR